MIANLGPSGKAQANPGTRAVELADNHALQLISFFYSDGDPKSAGVVYQLNAVLSDKSRREVFTLHIPAHREHPFRTNVNTYSGLT